MEIKLYDVLQQEKIISGEQSQKAKNDAYKKGTSIIGELIDAGYVIEDKLITFLKEKYNSSYFELSNYQIKEDIVKQIPVNIAKKFLVVPVAKSSNILAIVTVDPVSGEMLSAIQQLTDYYILPFIGRKEHIEKIIHYNYGSLFVSGKDSKGEKTSVSGVSGNPLVKDFLFDNFVTGSGNSFTYAIAMAVAKFPGGNYNPLFIYSKTGLGKTHLVNAIGNYLLATIPSTKIFYTNTEQFIADIVNAIENNTIKEFHNIYRNNDVLLIDDIHFLIGKERAQEEFFHTFNALSQTNRQIVVTSDRPPMEFQNIEERLKTRLSGGIITDIQPPDLETRVAILKKKINLNVNKIDLPEEVVFFIAQNFSNSVRELEGALNKIFGTVQLKLNGEKITVDIVKEELKDMLVKEVIITAKEEIPSLKKAPFRMIERFRQKIKQAGSQQDIIKAIEETVDFLVPEAKKNQNKEALNMLQEIKSMLAKNDLHGAFALISKLQTMKI